MNWLKNIFKKNNKSIIQNEIKLPNISSDDEWIEFEKQKPPHEVVLAACDTYDCGWTMDTVWWYEDKQCWMTTGGVNSEEAHLPYTHWRNLPPFPRNNETNNRV